MSERNDEFLGFECFFLKTTTTSSVKVSSAVVGAVFKINVP
jgi:hypothetical protein